MSALSRAVLCGTELAVDLPMKLALAVVAGLVIGCSPIVADGPDAGTVLDENHTLTVMRVGSNEESIVSSPVGIDCGNDCGASFPRGTEVTLLASQPGDKVFQGWEGCSPGQVVGSCRLTMVSDVTATATYKPRPGSITVSLAGDGDGTVTSSDGAINCASTCSAAYDYGAKVALTAAPAGGSKFAAWGGACTGTSATCVVTASEVSSVVASFDRNLRSVAVTVQGAGTVASLVASLDGCQDVCTASVAQLTPLTLTAQADDGYEFLGWSSPCGVGPKCAIVVDNALSLVAEFAPLPRTLHLEVSGAGRVRALDVGVDCTDECSTTLDHATEITLVASPVGNSRFSHWEQACTGTDVLCDLTVIGDHNVAAKFCATCSATECGQKPDGCGGTLDCGGCPINLAFTTSESWSGDLGGLVGADQKCQTAADNAGLSGSYRAFLSANGDTAGSRLSGASGWIRTDGRLVARTAAELVAKGPGHLMNIAETGEPLPHPEIVGEQQAVNTHTGLTAEGTPSPDNCNNYTSGANRDTQASGSAWSPWRSFFNRGGVSQGCNVAGRLYCFGIDHVATVSPSDLSHYRIAFVTHGQVAGDVGLAGADAQCNSEAELGDHLFGTGRSFKAFLATASEAAHSRFDLAGQTWARPDGIKLFDTAAEMAEGHEALQTTIHLHADGSGGFALPWVGIMGSNPASDNCSNWTSTAGHGVNGYSLEIYDTFNNSGTFCAAEKQLYCFEE